MHSRRLRTYFLRSLKPISSAHAVWPNERKLIGCKTAFPPFLELAFNVEWTGTMIFQRCSHITQAGISYLRSRCSTNLYANQDDEQSDQFYGHLGVGFRYFGFRLQKRNLVTGNLDWWFCFRTLAIYTISDMWWMWLLCCLRHKKNQFQICFG